MSITFSPIFVGVPPIPPQDGAPQDPRDGLRVEIQGFFNGTMQKLTGNKKARMRYARKHYAADIVLKHRCKVVGWPKHIPFKPVSEIRGGIRPLLELRRRWNLPDGHKDKLRIERATREDARNAAHDPDSVHPNPTQLKDEKAAAARAAARVVPSYTLHPGDLSLVGLDRTTTQPGPKTAKGKRAQRWDTGKRRKRASDTSTQVRKRQPMRGITSMSFVLPGVGETGGAGGDGHRAKRARLDDYALDDPITEFELSTDFGGSLSGFDAV